MRRVATARGHSHKFYYVILFNCKRYTNGLRSGGMEKFRLEERETPAKKTRIVRHGFLSMGNIGRRLAIVRRSPTCESSGKPDGGLGRDVIARFATADSTFATATRTLAGQL